MKNLSRKKTVEKIFAKVCKKYGIRNRRLTKDDFYRICEGEAIQLVNCDLSLEMLHGKIKARGVYVEYSRDGERRRLIYLKCFFQKYFNHFIAFHELGHFFMGHIEGTFERTYTRIPQKEAEADYFSELATGLKRRGAK